MKKIYAFSVSGVVRPMDNFFDAEKLSEYQEGTSRVLKLRCYATQEIYELVIPKDDEHYTREVKG